MTRYLEHDLGIQADYRPLIGRVVRIPGPTRRDAIVGTLDAWEPIGLTQSQATIVHRGGRKQSVIGGSLRIEPVRHQPGEHADLYRAAAAQEFRLDALRARHQRNEQGFCHGCGWGWPCPDAVILGGEDDS